MKKFILFMTAISIIGCSQYGEIIEDTFYLKFPIKIDTSNLNENWQMDSAYAGYSETFRLRAMNIKQIKLFDIMIDGNFTIDFINDGDEMLKVNDQYFFTKLVLNIPKNMKDSIFYKIQTQDVVNYIYFCEDNATIIDMENFILYNFFGSGQINVYDIKEMHSRRLY